MQEGLNTNHPARPRVGLVIGSGGIKCAAAIGLLKVLQREGIEVDVAVGCSGGAIYAAMLAEGKDLAAVEEKTLLMWQDLFKKLHYRSLVRAAAPRLFRFSERLGFVDDGRIVDVLREEYGDSQFTDTEIPLFLAATDLYTGEKVTLEQGSIFDAVRASIAIPLLLRPWAVDDRLLVDGGASNPLPIDVAIREGCDVIIAMGFENPLYTEFASFTKLLSHTTAVTMNHLLRSTFAFYSSVHHAEIVPMMPDFDRHISVTDAHLVPYIIEQGEAAAEAELPYLRSLLAQPA